MTNEQAEVLGWFTDMLRSATADGGRKRAAGLKPSWKIDEHEPALFSHLNKWKHGEVVDPDSGAHTLIHLAWRALAIAWQETHGVVAEDTGPRSLSQAYEAAAISSEVDEVAKTLDRISYCGNKDHLELWGNHTISNCSSLINSRRQDRSIP